MISILICDDQLLTREGLCHVIKLANSYETVGHTNLDNEVINVIRSKQPHVLLTDPFLTSQGLELLQQIKAQFPYLGFILVSNNTQRTEILKVFNLGIKCYVSKNASQSEIISGIAAAARNEKYVCAQTRQLLSEGQPDTLSTNVPDFSAREKEIIYLIAEGVPDKVIADKLFLSYHTIRTHRKNITKKLGFSLKNAAELVWLVNYLSDVI